MKGCASGIAALGNLEWGSHLCQLNQRREDLVDTLVPFFASGLASNEQCLWVTSEPLETEDAMRELANRVPDLQSKIDRGQIRIVGHSDWYGRAGRFDADSTLGAWIAAETSARANGYEGLRAAGHASFLKTRQAWQEFQRYEARVSETFAGRRLIVLCCYDLGKCDASDVLDLARHHHCCVVRRENEWELLGNMGAKQSQESLRAVNVQLEQRVRERTAILEESLREQLRVARAKDEFLAMLGHELRNPLAPMMNALQILRVRGVESREHQILMRQVTHMTRLVNDLLDVSRIAHGELELRKRPIEFSQIVIGAMEVVSPVIEQSQQTLDIQVAHEGLLIDADPERMRQVLVNLLANASKYSDPCSRIQLAAAREGAKVRCSVRDEGIGIAPEMLSGVFDPFVQQREALDRSRGGLGLGLAIVRNLVIQHGGRVHAASEGLGRGSEFSIELPLLEPDSQVAPVGVGADLGSTAPAGDGIP